MIKLRSVKKGIMAMTKNHGHVNYEITFDMHRKFWIEAWTPIWHEGRGPYISIGIYFISLFRGY